MVKMVAIFQEKFITGQFWEPSHPWLYFQCKLGEKLQFSITISAVGNLANFSWEVHKWKILETSISMTIFWMQIKGKFSPFHDLKFFWFSKTFQDYEFFYDFPRLSMIVGTLYSIVLVILVDVQHNEHNWALSHKKHCLAFFGDKHLTRLKFPAYYSSIAF